METLESSVPSSAQPLRPGDLVDKKFVVKRHLGSGATGHVYLAEHLVLSTDVAIKVLHSELNQNHGIRRRTPLGTPCYMAPEQLLDASGVDRRADYFAWGVVVYENDHRSSAIR